MSWENIIKRQPRTEVSDTPVEHETLRENKPLTTEQKKIINNLIKQGKNKKDIMGMIMEGKLPELGRPSLPYLMEYLD